MKSLLLLWEGLDRRARVGAALGCVLIAGLMVALAVWAYRPDYQVLFADMAPRDAAAMSAELDKMKTPYQLGDDGNTILVPRDLVYKTRLKLMGKDVPLHGAVGFEVFNNADFGMTEFVQKVNYLRAVQGELTRTILSIDDIQGARVHLAIPEQGLFKKAMTKPKASVTLTMKNGHALAQDQITGIQRLVAASVPDIASADVTVLDQHGVALTRVSGEATGEGGETQLDSKRSNEDYLLKKVMVVLDRTFGSGGAIASVDVVLNLDHGKVTTEEVLAAKGGTVDGSPTGVVVREKHSLRDSDTVAVGPTGGAARPAAGGNSTSESDYQVGRRVEQSTVMGGTVRRMTIAVVVKQNLSDAQLDKVREVVALAVGFNSARGDAIAVNSVDRLINGADPAATSALAVPAAPLSDAPAGVPAKAARTPDSQSATVVVWVLAATLVVAVLGGLSLLWRRGRTSGRVTLDDAARARMLADVRQWIDTPAAGATTTMARS